MHTHSRTHTHIHTKLYLNTTVAANNRLSEAFFPPPHGGFQWTFPACAGNTVYAQQLRHAVFARDTSAAGEMHSHWDIPCTPQRLLYSVNLHMVIICTTQRPYKSYIPPTCLNHIENDVNLFTYYLLHLISISQSQEMGYLYYRITSLRKQTMYDSHSHSAPNKKLSVCLAH